MNTLRDKKFFSISFICHLVFLLFFMLGLDWMEPMPVLENTAQHDVISAVVLGDTNKSKILPHPAATPKPPVPVKVTQPVQPQPVKIQPVAKTQPAPSLPDKQVIALKVQPKKITKKETQKQHDLLANDLLQDIQKVQRKQKAENSTNTFEKLLKTQAEKSLRQTLLNEDIKLQSTTARASSGVVNKYKALILQAISQQWNVPPGVDPDLHCMLLIRLAPTGQVLDVQISKTSGISELDLSARAAVMKASPLPVPTAPQDFEPFREFVLNVRPKDIVDGF